jgi:hypothetical protein
MLQFHVPITKAPKFHSDRLVDVDSRLVESVEETTLTDFYGIERPVAVLRGSKLNQTLTVMDTCRTVRQEIEGEQRRYNRDASLPAFSNAIGG